MWFPLSFKDENRLKMVRLSTHLFQDDASVKKKINHDHKCKYYKPSQNLSNLGRENYISFWNSKYISIWKTRNTHLPKYLFKPKMKLIQRYKIWKFKKYASMQYTFFKSYIWRNSKFSIILWPSHELGIGHYFFKK